MRGKQPVFYQRHKSGTSDHTRTDGLQYHIILVTGVPLDFGQKQNLDLNNQLDPQIVLCFGACTRQAKWCLFYDVFNYFVMEIYLSMETQ